MYSLVDRAVEDVDGAVVRGRGHERVRAVELHVPHRLVCQGGGGVWGGKGGWIWLCGCGCGCG